MNMKFSLYFFSQPVFAVHMDPSGLSSKRSHVRIFNRCSPHVIVRSEGAAKIQRLSGGGLNPNRDRTDEVGVKRTRNGWGSEVYTVCGDAVAPLWRVMHRLCGCRDRICPSIQPTRALPVCAIVPHDARGFVVLLKGFQEECLPGGRRFCAVVTFREVN